LLFKDALKTLQVHVNHALDQSVDNPFLLGVHIIDAEDFVSDILFRHLINMGNLEPVFVEKGYVQDFFELIVVVVPDVGISPLGPQKVITLFPDTDGMGFDAR
jgi:hypothetical protein